MNLHSKTLKYEKMIIRLLSCLKIILITRTMNIITWKVYLRNSYYEYERGRNLATLSKNPNIHSRFFVEFVSECHPSASDFFRLAS